MANEQITADIIVKEGLAQFKNNTPFLQGIGREYDDSYEVAGAKAGDFVKIQVPKEYKMRSGKTVDVQDNKEQSVTLSKTRYRGVDLRFSTAELEQDISMFSEQIITPAMNTLSSGIEYECFTDAYQQVANHTGTPGTHPATMLPFTDAKAYLTKNSTPQTERSAVLSPDGMSALVNGLGTNRFEDRSQLRNQFVTGNMGTMAGLEFAESVNVNRHTVGTGDGNYVINTAASEGASTLSVTTGTGTFTKGDILTVAAVNQVNPLSKQTTGGLKEFTVTADYAGGAGTVSVDPAMYAEGPLQNVDALPASSAVIAELGTNSTAFDQNMIYHKKAFTIATVDLPLPGMTDFESRMNFDGISMRLAKVWDGKNDDMLYRLDILYGFITVIPRWAVRLWGA